jgi:small subunit ribosomal protein S16
LVKIRLQRHGRIRLPYYHIVVADSRARRDGRIIQDLGRYSPTEQPAMVKVDADKVIAWINKGAQPTDTVRSILKKEGIYLRMHLQRWGKSTEEIEQAVAEFKAGKAENKSSGSVARRAAVKNEEDRVAKADAARAVEDAKKAKEAEEAAKNAEAAAKAVEAAPVVEEAPVADEAIAEAVAEEPVADEAVAEAPAEEAPAAEETSEDKTKDA